MEGYKEPFCKDRNKNGGGLLVYAKEDIPSCELKIHPPVSDLSDMVVNRIKFQEAEMAIN